MNFTHSLGNIVVITHIYEVNLKRTCNLGVTAEKREEYGVSHKLLHCFLMQIWEHLVHMYIHECEYVDFNACNVYICIYMHVYIHFIYIYTHIHR